MANGHGGARSGAGAPKGAHRIHAGELRKAIEQEIGRPYVELLAESQRLLFEDFKQGRNVREYITFTENMSRRIIEDSPVQVQHTAIKEMTDQELRDQLANLLDQEKPQDE